MPTHGPGRPAPNYRLRAQPIALNDANGRYLDHAQEYEGALYTIHGNRFPEQTISRMGAEDADRARAATQPWG